jgi:outer membrane receptor protein involved in Fe transport
VSPRLPFLVLPVLAAQPAVAGETPDAASPENDAQLEEVLVYGIYYRNRTTDVAPVLSYDLEYFQRFEPSTVGDMLKRVPAATFVSDVLEYDGVQLRGLDPGYTQVLVNGRKVPGAGDDRSFWVDRIPAELVERVEILRSNSANRTGEAMAGALNIVLRDSYTFDANYLRVGAMRYDDGELKPTVGAVLSGDVPGGRLLAGLNMQDRYNPKIKRSDRFSDPVGMQFDTAEDQTDTRDGQDYSANFSYTADVGATGRLVLDGFWVRTDRELVEVSTEFDAPRLEEASEVARVPGYATVDQDNWSGSARYSFDMAGGVTEFRAELARFEDRSIESEEEIVFVDGVWDGHEGEKLQIDSSDRETTLRLAHKRALAAAGLELGVDWRDKRRNIRHTYFAFELDSEGEVPQYQQDGIVRSLIKERRLDPYLMLSGTAGRLDWEAGLRYETTRSDIAGEADIFGSDYDVLLPSLHLKWNISENDRIGLSLARSLRRPAFNHLVPAVLEGEFGDNDFVGQPGLQPEKAWGVDLGFERRLGRRGVAGINFFYRDVDDLIEPVNTGSFSAEAEEDIGEYMEENGVGREQAIAAVDPDSFVYTMGNVGDGRVWGVEFDLSAPLTVVGLSDTGAFLNYAWLDSEVEDFMGRRRFNNQARSVYNVGFIHNMPALRASFGASYRKQGRAMSRVLAEEVTTTYGADLELFLEKSFGRNLSLRLSGTNLLDAKKREYFHKFDTVGDQLDRDYDEYELEEERAGARYQLVLRWAF